MPYKNPDRQRAAKAESARRRRAQRLEPSRGNPWRAARRRNPAGDGPGRPRVIESQIEAVLADEELGTTERARTAATLCGIALRAIEQADLAARAEALERALEATPAK